MGEGSPYAFSSSINLCLLNLDQGQRRVSLSRIGFKFDGQVRLALSFIKDARIVGVAPKGGKPVQFRETHERQSEVRVKSQCLIQVLFGLVELRRTGLPPKDFHLVAAAQIGLEGFVLLS